MNTSELLVREATKEAAKLMYALSGKRRRTYSASVYTTVWGAVLVMSILFQSKDRSGSIRTVIRIGWRAGKLEYFSSVNGSTELVTNPGSKGSFVIENAKFCQWGKFLFIGGKPGRQLVESDILYGRITGVSQSRKSMSLSALPSLHERELYSWPLKRKTVSLHIFYFS